MVSELLDVLLFFKKNWFGEALFKFFASLAYA